MPTEFWSNTEGSGLMTGLMRDLEQMDCPATQRWQVSNEAYRSARSGIARLWLRVRMYVLYPFQVAFFFLFCRKPGVAVVCTNTFFAPFLAGLLASRRRPVIHLVYDLYPDVLVAAGTLTAGSMSVWVMRWLTARTFYCCSANVFLGQHLMEYAERTYGQIPNATIIPVGADGSPFRNHFYGNAPAPLPRWISSPKESFRTILYCGNFGRMHDYETLARVLREDRWQSGCHVPLVFKFHANGMGLSKLKEAMNLACDCSTMQLSGGIRLEFHGNLPDGEWVEVMKASDVALVTMSPGAENVVMPSKTYSAMVAGQAILAVCPVESDLAVIVRKHDCGWVVAPGDVRHLQAVLDEIAYNHSLLLKRRLNSYRAGQEHYDTAVISKQWVSLFNALRR